jgi:hypothetical protein
MLARTKNSEALNQTFQKIAFHVSRLPILLSPLGKTIPVLLDKFVPILPQLRKDIKRQLDTTKDN